MFLVCTLTADNLFEVFGNFWSTLLTVMDPIIEHVTSGSFSMELKRNIVILSGPKFTKVLLDVLFFLGVRLCIGV